jgi:hypothetical protein
VTEVPVHLVEQRGGPVGRQPGDDQLGPTALGAKGSSD